MSAHTPGPWIVVERETMKDDSVYPRHIIGGARGLEVCYLESLYVAQQGDTSDAMFEAVGDVRSKAANARLIAAAPCLLEALEMVRDYIRTMKGSDHEYTATIDAAIAKAKGETP